MKLFRKALALILVVSMAFAFSAEAFAEDEVLLVNFGDSIAWGQIEDWSAAPGYDLEKKSYSGLLAGMLGTERVSYTRRGMQTTDVLYMIDEAFQADVDQGRLKPDSWYPEEYPPRDGTSLEEVRSNTAKADYIMLCVGVCDFISYPDSVRDEAMANVPDADAILAELKELFGNGTIDQEAFELLSDYLEAEGEKASITVSLILDVLKGFADYLRYYPRIVETLRSLNETATIILVGVYLQGGRFPFLIETEESSKLIPLLNRLFDQINLTVKLAAAQNGCVYVDTMGIESDWHPTPLGHQQICDRIVSVLSGDPTYAGGVYVSPAVTGKFLKELRTELPAAEKKTGFAGFLDGLFKYIGRIYAVIFNRIVKAFKNA